MTAGSPPNPRLRRLVALGLALAAFVLYLPSLRSGFVYDAQIQIEHDSYVHTSAHLVDVLTLRVLGQDVVDGTRPVHLLVLLLESLAWGRHPFGYHLTSILLHALTAGILFLLLENLGRKTAPLVAPGRILGAAALATLLFIVHPVQVEAVAEVSYREDPLAALGILLALLLAADFPARTRRATILRGTGCVTALGFAVAAKETGVAGPILLALCGWAFHRREPRAPWVTLITAATVVVVGFTVARFALPPAHSEIFLAKPTYVGGSFQMAALTQPRLWALLLFNTAWPTRLSADYQPENMMALALPVVAAVLVIFLAAQILLALKSRLALLGAAIFWVGLAPVSNFIPIYRPLADRFLYLPFAGLAASLCAALLLLAPRKTAFALSAGILTLGAIAMIPPALARQAVFANPLNLWRDTADKSPSSLTAANNLGSALLESGELEEALNCFGRALRFSHQRDANAWIGGAFTLEHMGRYTDAETAVRRAIAIDPRYADPDGLVKSLLLTPDQGGQLKGILVRMPDVAPTPHPSTP